MKREMSCLGETYRVFSFMSVAIKRDISKTRVFERRVVSSVLCRSQFIRNVMSVLYRRICSVLSTSLLSCVRTNLSLHTRQRDILILTISFFFLSLTGVQSHLYACGVHKVILTRVCFLSVIYSMFYF